MLSISDPMELPGTEKGERLEGSRPEAPPLF